MKLEEDVEIDICLGPDLPYHFRSTKANQSLYP